MAETTTTHYELTKPEPGGSADTWGDTLNDDLDIIDAELKAVSDVADGALVASSNLDDLTDASAARTNLGVAIGSNVQAYHGNLAALSGLSIAANTLPYGNGTGTCALATFTAAGRALVDDADAAAQRTTLGLAIGTNVQAYSSTLTSLASASANGVSLVQAANYAAMADLLGLATGTNVQAHHGNLDQLAGLSLAANKLPYANGTNTLALADFTAAGRALVDDADAAAQRTTLGLAIGTNVQAYHANLAAFAGLTIAADKLAYGNGSGTLAMADLTSAGRALLDDADAAAQRTTLGLGSAALKTSGIAGSGDLPTRADGDARYGLESLIIAMGDETTAITAGAAKVTFRMPFAMTGISVRSSLTTASSSGLVTVDINEAGASILSTKLSIDAGEKTSTTAATAAVVSDSSLADDAEVTFDIDAAGTGAAGLKVTISGTRVYP